MAHVMLQVTFVAIGYVNSLAMTTINKSKGSLLFWECCCFD